MSDENQIYLPASFLALYAAEGRKPRIPRDELLARYELCEDLANQLVDYARTLQFDLGISEDEVLLRSYRGLLADPATVTPDEALWVVRRTAELSGWEIPDFEPGS